MHLVKFCGRLEEHRKHSWGHDTEDGTKFVQCYGLPEGDWTHEIPLVDIYGDNGGTVSPGPMITITELPTDVVDNGGHLEDLPSKWFVYLRTGKK